MILSISSVAKKGGSILRIAELARVAGIPVPTIKFYLREGLLPPGERTAANQAAYSEAHVRRLRSLRVLTEVGGLSLRQAKVVALALDDGDRGGHETVGDAQHALGPEVADDPAPDAASARYEVDRFVDDDLGWQVSTGAPARRVLARALVALRRSGRDVDVSVFRPYARAADWLASEEIEAIERRAKDRGDLIEQVIVGTLVFESATIALGRLAREHRSARPGRPVAGG